MFNIDCDDQLTDREIEVLQILAEGHNNKQISDRLGIKVRTVKFHTANIYKKIKVSSRSEAIVWILRNVNLPMES